MLFLNYTLVRVLQLHLLLRITLIENLIERCKQADCWSLIEHLSAILTELKLLNAGARVIDGASLSS